jgi:hypothetical protein
MTGREAGHLNHESILPQQKPQAGAVNPDALEVAPGTKHEKLEGWIPELASEEEIRAALEKAFDYRGDASFPRTQLRKSRFLTPTSRRCLSAAATLLPERAGKRG